MVTVRSAILPPPPFRRVLLDGTRVLFRAIRPDDAPILREGIRQLSSASRYGRFHCGRRSLSSAELRYLTEIDYRDHMAWLAFDLTRPERAGLAVGRYVRLTGEPRAAEVAITVCDSHQGRGLGALLFDALAGAALRNGIDVFRAYLLSGNEAALRLARRFGAHDRPAGHGRLSVETRLCQGPEASAVAVLSTAWAFGRADGALRPSSKCD